MIRLRQARRAGAVVGVMLALLLGFYGAVPGGAALAQGLSGLSRVSGPITVVSAWRSLTVTVPLTQPVPWRTRLMLDPPRAVVDFRTVDWTGVDVDAIALSGAARAVRVGEAGSGWSRLIIELSRPMGFSQASMTTDPDTDTALVTLQLEALSDDAFAAQAAALSATDRHHTEALAVPVGALPLGQRLTRVVLDPGHGGVDPGAIHGGVTEAETMLQFALELAETLRRTGRYDVVLTRQADVFVSLEARITVAHSAVADLFVSLHADALEDGEATGATLYTLAEHASDAASAALAERHDRNDLLGGGVDLAGADDTVATALMALARTQTGPATDALARALVAAIQEAGLRMHRHPWQHGAFSVLKSATVPSVLLEVGFLSSARDRRRLRDPEWRARMVQAVVAGLDDWVLSESARSALRRR